MSEQENEMTMIEKLSEELGEKELKIMEQEKQIQKLCEMLEKKTDIIDYAESNLDVYICHQCEYLTDNRMRWPTYRSGIEQDKKTPDDPRCQECRDDDSDED